MHTDVFMQRATTRVFLSLLLLPAAGLGLAGAVGAQGLTGNVDGIIEDSVPGPDQDSLNGWAIDPNQPSLSLVVDVFASNVSGPVATGPTRFFRPDLLNLHPNWNPNVAGFRIRLPPRFLFAPGTTFTAAIHSGPALGGSVATPFSVAAVGDLENIDADGTATGWGLAPATSPSNGPNARVELYLDDLNGESLVDIVPFSIQRSAGGHSGVIGFSSKLPPDILYGLGGQLHAYAVDRTSAPAPAHAGAASALTHSGSGIPNPVPMPTGSGLVLNTSGLLTGTASDPKTPGASVKVDVFGDGPADIGVLIGTALTSAGSGAFTFQLPSGSTWTSGAYHRIHVAVRDSTSSTLFAELPGSPLEIGTQNYSLVMCPAMGARDYSALFSDAVTPLADLFCFFGGHWNYGLGNSPNGTFWLNGYTTSGPALSNLSALRSSVATWSFEAPAIKPWGNDQNGTDELVATATAATNMLGNMGSLTSVGFQFDEPLSSGRFDPPATSSGGPHPAMTTQAIASIVANEISFLVANWSGINKTICEIEPYPSFSSTDLTDYLTTLLAQPSLPKFDVFALDVARSQVQSIYRSRWREHLRADLQHLSVFCKGQSIRFAPLLWGDTPPGTLTTAELNADGATCYAIDQAFVANATDWASIVGEAIGIPDVIQPQSWHTEAISDAPPFAPGFVPDCVTQTRPTFPDASFAKLTWDSLVTLTHPAASFVSSQSSVPATVNRNTAFTALIAMRNDGHVPWNLKKQFWLAATGSTNWGVSRVNVPSGVNIVNSQVLVFTINAHAPLTQGTYQFSWQMTQADRRPFGPAVSFTIKVK